MPLGFLVPAFLAGLLVLVIPILVHLTRSRRSEVVEFPSLMFLERVPYRAERRRKIHHWLLLLLRALAVALIVGAFARPFFQDAEATGVADAGPRELVVLVDRSWSMTAGDRWERAREEARNRIREMGPLDRGSVVFFASNAHAAVRSSTDRAGLLRALDTATVSHQATAYGPGLKLARTILESTDLPHAELVVVGDFQRTGWDPTEEVRMPPGTAVTPVRVGEPVGPHRAVAGVSFLRERFAGRERVTPTARIVRSGGTDGDEVDVVLEVEGRELERRSVRLPGGGAREVSFQPFVLAERHTPGTVRIDGSDGSDPLPPDDRYHFVLSPGRAVSVLILQGPGAGSSLYLRRALEVARADFSVALRRSGALGPGELEGRHVVVVDDRSLAGGSTVQALRAFVEAGGGLVVALGEDVAWPEAGADLLPGSFSAPVDGEPGGGGRLGQIAYDHPVFQVFQGPRTGDFGSARFFRSRDLRLDEADGVRVLARFDDGSVALAEKRVGAGRALVWTSTLDAFWNDLPLQPVFVPFVHQLTRYASGRRETLSSFTAGQIVDVRDGRAMEAAGLGEAAALVTDPDGERVALAPSGEALPLSAEAGSGYLRLEEQGFYRIRPAGRDDVRPVSVAVNVDLAESDPDALDVEEAAATLAGPPAGDPGPSGGDAAGATRLRMEDQERRQSLWRFLLIGAFVLLAAETLISNWISRPVRAARTAGGRQLDVGT